MLRRIWPDRLGGQIALLLSLALALEFAGTEWLFNRIEGASDRDEHARYLISHMMVANHVAEEEAPEKRQAKLENLWQSSPRFTWYPASQVQPARNDPKNLKALSKFSEEAKGLRNLQSGNVGHNFYARWQLRDGSWVQVQGGQAPRNGLPYPRHLGSLLMLLICVGLVANVVARKIIQPLRDLSDHADGMDRVIDKQAEIEGPYEVRQVAQAYNNLQRRMAAQVEERLQSLAAVSHDLRTPIARMSLRASRVEDAQLRAQMMQDLGEMESFVGALLDYLRGADPESDRLVNVASLLMTIIYGAQDLGHQAEYHGPAKLEVMAKPIKLQRIVQNLVENAVRHAGNVDLYLSQQHGGIEILVEDDGAGLPPDQLSRVLEPFVRIEGSRNRQTGGAGLGLAIVKKSVDRMGGRISLENRADGGLRARIFLPITPDDHAPMDVATAS
jgi:signal transduction histidine kinase